MSAGKKFLDWILTVNLLVVTGVCLYLWWAGVVSVQVSEPVRPSAAPAAIDPKAEQLFVTTLRDEVDRQLGQPTNGYTPEQFTTVFPGLVATDFEDVEASIGKYVVVEGQLVHVTPPGTPVHSAATAVTSRGLVTLLRNVADRAQIDLTDSGTITDVMQTISGG